MNKEVFILTVTDDYRDAERLAEETIAVCESFDKAVEVMKGDKNKRVWFTSSLEKVANIDDNTWANIFWLESENHDDDVYVIYTITRWEVI